MAKASTFKTAKVVKSLKSPKTPKANKLGKKAGKADDRLKTGLDPSLVGKAVEALLKYNAKQAEKAEKQVLIGNDKPVQVQFTLMRAPGHSTPKPVRVLIPHPLFKLADKDNSERSDEEDIEEPEICLIVKEESKAWCQELISKFPNHMGCVKKVLGLQSLRKKHARYEQRRELLNKYNFFMADDRILPMLSKSLGTDFFKAKKLPIPINLTRKEALPFAIQKALSATYMTVSTGTCVMVRAGHTGMAPEKLVENIVEISKNAVPKIPFKWANIQVVSIKTPDSVALPIYNKTPDALKELGIMAGLEEDIETPPEEEKDDQKKADLEAAKSKKRDMKSPLVRALKKQKQVEMNKEKQKAEKRKKAEEAEKESAKQKSKRKSSESLEPRADDADEKVAEKKGTAKEKKQRTSSVGSAKDEKGSAKKKKAETPESSKKATKKNKEDDDGENKDFIEAKKFKGSKKGYVFKKGPSGLGYYVDIKPKVNNMKIEAILRSSKNSSGRGRVLRSSKNSSGRGRVHRV